MLLTVPEQITNLSKKYNIVDIIDCDFDNLESAKIDIYMSLKKVFKPTYEPNERIIVVVKKDFYSQSDKIGYLLRVFQHILQEIDISNFFICLITTNNDILKEYQTMHEVTSIDPVRWEVYQCQGQYQKIITEKPHLVGKFDVLKNYDTLVSLSTRQKNLLFTDPVFCIAPWMSIHINSVSNVAPCCEFSDPGLSSNIKKQPLTETWNSSLLKKTRRDMLAGHQPRECRQCYIKESLGQDSLRKSMNRDYADKINLVDTTHADGHLDRFELAYIDIRWSNLCNLACRSCDPSLSSSWYQIHNYLNPDRQIKKPLHNIQDHSEIIEHIKQNIDHVEKIYFAGGEPMMIEEFYQLIEFLDSVGKNDVHLMFVTNLTRLSLKHYSMIDLWKKFKKVTVRASLDGMDARGEYLRSGSVWQEICDNRMAILKECPHVDLYVHPTTGIINALHIPDFHRSWVDQNYIRPEDFHVQILFNPRWQSLYCAPKKLRQAVIEKYTRHLDWLRPLDKLGRATSGFNSIIELCKQDNPYDRDTFWNMVGKFDTFYGTDLIEYFPELSKMDL